MKISELVADYRASSPWLLAVGLVAAAVVSSLVRRATARSDKKRPTRERTWSFTSVSMVQGGFPEKTKVPETIINAAIFFDKVPGNKELSESIVRPMLKYKRLNTIPCPETHSCRPSTRIVVDPGNMIRRLVVSGDEKLTIDTISNHLQDSLSDPSRGDLPWWEYLIVENTGKGKSACVLRIHHALADGISLVGLFEKMITYRDGTPYQSSVLSGKKTKTPVAKRAISLSFVATLLKEFVHVLTLGMTSYDDDTAFSTSNKGLVHNQKRTPFIFPEVPLDFVKILKNAAGVSVNDILMTVVGEAIREFCLSQNCRIMSSSSSSAENDIQCRALLPVALPRTAKEMEDTETALRNYWCFVSIDLGVGCADVADRLKYIHRRTQEMKTSPRAMVQMAVQNFAANLPLAVGQQTVYDIFSRHSVVFSNVPGPDQPICMAGKIATGVQMFYSNLIPQIGLVSYAGKVYGNIILDPTAVPNADKIAIYYATAFVKLADRLDVNKKDIPTYLAAMAASTNG